MKDNFDLKKFLVENKLTSNSRLLEDFDFDFTAADDSNQYDADFGDDDDDDDTSDGDNSHDFQPPEDQKNIPAWKALKSSLQGDKGRLLRFTDYDTEGKVETLNWGTAKEAGHSMGVGVGMDKDFKYIEVTLLHHSQEDQAAMNNAFKQAGLSQYKNQFSSDTGSSYKIPVSDASKVVQPLKTVAALADKSGPEADKGSFGDLGNKTGPVKAGPATTPQGSVKVGGKTFTGR